MHSLFGESPPTENCPPPLYESFQFSVGRLHHLVSLERASFTLVDYTLWGAKHSQNDSSIMNVDELHLYRPATAKHSWKGCGKAWCYKQYQVAGRPIELDFMGIAK
jgi:hypothetical protein